jgi:ectoine hydroxylase-related dioxygenase (phytanoyl-CoA dioxygenase family)
MDLSAEQRGALDREGFILVEGALDAGWLAQLARAFEAAPAQADGTQHVALSDATPEIEAWRRLENHPTVVAAAAYVLGGPIRVRDLHGRNPLPGYGQQGLHADSVTRAAGDPYSVVTALWMIDAFTDDNGATRVVPGSHRLTRPPPTSFAQPLARHPDERVITGAAGSVLVFNGHLWHSGRRNTGSGPRRAGQMVLVAR